LFVALYAIISALFTSTAVFLPSYSSSNFANTHVVISKPTAFSLFQLVWHFLKWFGIFLQVVWHFLFTWTWQPWFGCVEAVLTF